MADQSKPQTQPDRAADPDVHTAAMALGAVLRQLAGVVENMSGEQYAARGVGYVEGSTGGHVRHGLDHVTALLGGMSTGCIDYETRRRGTDVETNRDAAVSGLTQAAGRVERIEIDDLAQPVRVIVRFTADGGTVAMGSTLGRELAFVLSHTIHHNALIAAIAVAQGIELPEYFGFAPSSVAFLKQQ